jgi:ariadne-1
MGNEDDGQVKTPFLCKHLFHDECLTEYFEYIISKNAMIAYKIKCPFKDCNITIHEDKLKFYIKEKFLKDRYEEYCLRSFVSEQKSVKWCPKPGCN